MGPKLLGSSCLANSFQFPERALLCYHGLVRHLTWLTSIPRGSHQLCRQSGMVNEIIRTKNTESRVLVCKTCSASGLSLIVPSFAIQLFVGSYNGRVRRAFLFIGNYCYKGLRKATSTCDLFFMKMLCINALITIFLYHVSEQTAKSAIYIWYFCGREHSITCADSKIPWGS